MATSGACGTASRLAGRYSLPAAEFINEMRDLVHRARLREEEMRWVDGRFGPLANR